MCCGPSPRPASSSRHSRMTRRSARPCSRLPPRRNSHRLRCRSKWSTAPRRVLADEAAGMAALLDCFSTEKTHLFAHDDGAEVAVQFALDFPARTLSLALLAPTLEGFPWKDQTLAARRDLLSVFARSPRAAIEEKWLTSPAFDVVRALEGPFERLRTLYGRARVAGGSLARPAHPGPTQAERLGEIRTRTLAPPGARPGARRGRAARAARASGADAGGEARRDPHAHDRPRGRPRGLRAAALRGRDRPGHSRGGRDDVRRRVPLSAHRGPAPRHAAADGLLHSTRGIEDRS